MITNNGNVNAVFVNGNTGEGIVRGVLEQSNLTFYHDIYIESNNGKVTQIDFLVVTDRALVCIEVKNYNKCVIKGDDITDFWTACYRSGTKNFLNPIKQNRAHVNACKGLFDFDIPVYNMVVFANGCSIRTVPTSCQDTSVINISDVWYVLIDIKGNTRYKRFNTEIKKNIVAVFDEFYSRSVELYDKHQEQHFNKKSK